MLDPRIIKFREAAAALRRGEYQVAIPTEGNDEVAQLGLELSALAYAVEKKFEEMAVISTLTERINAGLLLDEILEQLFNSFRPIIPYDRIGFSLIDPDDRTIRARWAKSDAPNLEIGVGYTGSLEGSSLEQLIETRQPRILNDLEEYLRNHPDSDATRRIVKEGMRSSLTCPLIAMGKPIGFIFFSSMAKNTYRDVHVGIFRQIAGQLSIIVEKGRLYQKMLEINDVKNKFLGIVAHDLRHPLGSVKGFINLFLEGYVGSITGEQRELLADADQVLESMLALINNLLDVSILDSGKLSLYKVPGNIAELIRAVLNMYKHQAFTKGIKIEVKVPENLPDVEVDQERFKQIVGNLLSNAIKFSHGGTTITITAKAVRHQLLVGVADQGQGIPEHEQINLFKEFSKLSVRPTAGETSTGLGLTIVKRMVEAHDGRIWVESKVGTGTTFYFTLPRSVDDL